MSIFRRLYGGAMEVLKMPPSLLPGVITQRAAVGLIVEPKVQARVQERSRWHFPYLERTQGVLDGVRRGAVGPPRGPVS